MKNTPRDGIFTDNGLTAEFRFIRPHPASDDMSVVDTAWGQIYVHDSTLTFDPIRDLTPEAAAVVAKEMPE